MDNKQLTHLSLSDRPTNLLTNQPTNQPTNQLHGAESFLGSLTKYVGRSESNASYLFPWKLQ